MDVKDLVEDASTLVGQNFEHKQAGIFMLIGTLFLSISESPQYALVGDKGVLMVQMDLDMCVMDTLEKEGLTLVGYDKSKVH